MNLRNTLRFTRRTTTVAVLLLLVAAPAMASIIVQNFMQAEITAADPCFNKVGGNDPAGSGLADYADEDTLPQSTYTTTEDGVTLIGEQISLTGLRNDRAIYTDVVRYQNTCDTPIQVRLTAADAGTTAWTGYAAELWISNVDASVTDPADVDPNIDVVADHWNNTQIIVPSGSSGLITGANASTGTVTVPVGGEVQGAFIVTTADAAAGSVTLQWVAEAVIPT